MMGSFVCCPFVTLPQRHVSARKRVTVANVSMDVSRTGPAVLWIWRELRVFDNPALHRASNSDALAVVFVADPKLYGRSVEEEQFLSDAVVSMRNELRKRGSDLFIRRGNAAKEVAHLARSLNATTIYTTENADSAWHDHLHTLKAEFSGPVEVLRDTLTTTSYGSDFPEVYSSWRRLWSDWSSLFRPKEMPYLPPELLPNAPEETTISTGEFEPLGSTSAAGYFATILLEKEHEDDVNCKACRDFTPSDLISSPDTTLHSIISRQGDIFRSLQTALQFGCVSAHQLRQAGAVEEVKAKRWHRLMALSDQQRNPMWRYWLWRGCLVRYRASGALSDPSAPAILFVHGFGASIDHYAKNVEGLERRGVKVFALDLLGFGRAEKPKTQYTQHLWEAQIASFVREIVREPAFVVGNSIGGYMSMLFATDHHPSLCKGVALLNSAGSIGAPVKQIQERKEISGRNELIASTGKGLIFLLQSQIKSILVKLYPVQPEQVTQELVRNIYRDSTDPGATYVLESGARLPQRRTLEELFAVYRGPLLLLQGMKDPLIDADARAKAIKAAYDEAEVHLLEAGHCPHDEIPDVVNEKLLAWVNSRDQGAEASNVSVTSETSSRS